MRLALTLVVVGLALACQGLPSDLKSKPHGKLEKREATSTTTTKKSSKPEDEVDEVSILRVLDFGLEVFRINFCH
jgi:hypothetical protein